MTNIDIIVSTQHRPSNYTGSDYMVIHCKDQNKHVVEMFISLLKDLEYTGITFVEEQK